MGIDFGEIWDIILVYERSRRDVMNYTYILLCKDGTLYTGWTNDLKKRIKAHNMGKGAKYTKARRPVKLVYYEEFQTKGEAMKRECTIKRMGRKEKEKMIECRT